ncbi:putative periplasmic binding protein [Magnetospirillum sp. XM-1]|uniref:phosphate/phosphite/phosphonate ABC transporter substrate-binding protein n=1 Tax=Magnetospirillum sp. XM-1 TaxID=1663591 RepID=UPI00073DD231|nr:phosphate/phosphite/phosphonate ABC transporter substrate-binding protein [Magnetospirillum sp. XM-1]CUW37851.1 putative periplasmic binding protein [Magnetospirillum sp. XM-1]
MQGRRATRFRQSLAGAVFTFVWCVGLGLGLLPARPALAQTQIYSFGVLSQRSAVLTAQYWNPILDYVARRSGIMLVLKVARTAPESNAATEAGEYDVVYSNTIFQPSMAAAGYRVILKPRTAAITGQIVTLANSPVDRLDALAGHEVGFPSQVAFVGYAVPMDHLLREGIRVEPVFGGNQEGIMAQLKAGKVMAAGVNSQIMRAFATRENVQYRVLWESKPFLNIPVAVHPRVPAETAEAIRRVLAAMADEPEGRRLLEDGAHLLGQSPPFGFAPSSPAEYSNYSEFYRHTLVKDIK